MASWESVSSVNPVVEMAAPPSSESMPARAICVGFAAMAAASFAVLDFTCFCDCATDDWPSDPCATVRTSYRSPATPTPTPTPTVANNTTPITADIRRRLTYTRSLLHTICFPLPFLIPLPFDPRLTGISLHVILSLVGQCRLTYFWDFHGLLQ